MLVSTDTFGWLFLLIPTLAATSSVLSSVTFCIADTADKNEVQNLLRGECDRSQPAVTRSWQFPRIIRFQPHRKRQAMRWLPSDRPPPTATTYMPSSECKSGKGLIKSSLCANHFTSGFSRQKEYQ